MTFFNYQGKKYHLNATKNIDNVGDLKPKTRLILIDKMVSKKFHEGIAVHEIEERKELLKGHTYVYAHNEAQKKELEFYEKKYGKNQGINVLKEEEAIVLTIAASHSKPNNFKIPVNKKIIYKRPVKIIITKKNHNRWAIFKGKKYLIDGTKGLIGTLADVYKKGRIAYIDHDVPEKFYEGLILCELICRDYLRKGVSWSEAMARGNRTEKCYYLTKYGPRKGIKMFNDELRFQAKKFDLEKKNLKKQKGHKVIYEKGEILPW